MSQPEENDPIDVLLREQSPHLDDNGFTGRVLAALPRRRRVWLRPTVLLGITAIGAALALRWLPWENLSPLDLSVLLSLNSQALLPWFLVLCIATSLAWAVTAAMQEED
ncbi:MAG TPA: hypothetical protein VNL17_01035 [Verrucomicrobiae bacterium]|nr:hypothetical protein [Verrucomicrobiae bacterium]